MNRFCTVVVATVALTTLGSQAVLAAPLAASDILAQFNAVVLGTFTSNSDVEGRLVTGEMAGGATFRNQVRGYAADSSYAEINAIKIDQGINANINNGGSVNIQTNSAGTSTNQGSRYVLANGSAFNFNGGGTVVTSPSFALSDFSAPLTTLTTNLAGLSANSTVNGADPNNYTFNAAPDAHGLAVFSITSTSLQGARNLNFNANGANTIVIDVSGASFSGGSVNFNASTFLNQNVIWDFSQATSVSFAGWHGTILAPNATVTNSSALEGDLFAQNFNGSGELHDFSFKGTLPTFASDPIVSGSAPVPEPASLTCLGAGLIGLGALRRPVANAIRTKSAANPAT